MKTLPALLVLLAVTCLAVPAQAQQRLSGTFRVEAVGGQEPPEGVELTMAFAEGGKATVTFTLGDEAPQSWAYGFTVEDGQLTLEPANAFGEPKPVSYDIRFEDGKLLLLTPKPEPVEEDDTETEDAGKEEGKEEGEEGDTAAESDTAGETGADESADEASGDAADADESTEGDTDATDADADADADSDDDDKEEEEEEDTREPEWVLVQVS